MSLLYEDQTRILRRCFFDVHNEVLLGRDEDAYHRACEIWLAENRIPFASRPQYRLTIGGETAYTLIPDLVVWDLITLELKSVRRGLHKTEYVQLFDYLKFRRDELGILVNFGLERVQVKRLVYTPAAPRRARR